MKIDPEFLKDFNQYKHQRDFINLIEWELSRAKAKVKTKYVWDDIAVKLYSGPTR